MNYEEEVLEQENRTFFNKPVRHTTLQFWPDKLTYKEAMQAMKSMGVQENLQSGEHFIEWWVELFLSYHEIEQEDYTPDIKEKCYKNFIIDQNIENRKQYELHKDLYT